jgi:hypothetical protein
MMSEYWEHTEYQKLQEELERLRQAHEFTVLLLADARETIAQLTTSTNGRN